MTLPPKPQHRPGSVSFLRHLAMFRQDILSTQPARLYRAKMAEFRLPFLRSFLINQPDLIRTVLSDRPDDFPKSHRVREGLLPLLGNSVFVTNGDQWKRQRRMIDPAFEGGRLRDTFPAMLAAGQAAVGRLSPGGVTEVEGVLSHAAADVIFRTLFSIPIEDRIAAAVFEQFRAHQRTQPILNLAAMIPWPRWLPRPHRRTTRATAAAIRDLIGQLTVQRKEAIAAGTAPNDLATQIMTTKDPVTGDQFDSAEMIDQVAIFFLAGHETSASALSWALYLLATHPEVQENVAAEADAALAEPPVFATLSKLPFTRDVFRETLRLYPSVPMMVRQTTRSEVFRNRQAPRGAQVIISPWHMGRNENIWPDPHAFRPDRWQTPENRAHARDAYLPFSAGPRVCSGAGFAMAEGVLLLALLTRAFRFSAVPGRIPVPVAHLTVRSKSGIWLDIQPRS